MNDFLTIKDFSDLSGVEQTTLRYWDDIKLFTPARRDPDNNYRYYTPDQLIAVNFIKVLSELNIPLKIIAELRDNRTPEKVAKLIEDQESLLDIEMNRLRECHSIIHERRELIRYGSRLIDGFREVDGVIVNNDKDEKKGKWIDVNEITVLHKERKNFVIGPENYWKGGEPFFENFNKFCDAASDLRINLGFPIVGYHSNFEAFLKGPGEPERFCSLDPTGNKSQPEGTYLVAFNIGYYGEFGDAADRMVAYIKKHKLRIKGPVFSVFLLDEVCVPDPDKYLSQISVAVE